MHIPITLPFSPAKARDSRSEHNSLSSYFNGNGQSQLFFFASAFPYLLGLLSWLLHFLVLFGANGKMAKRDHKSLRAGWVWCFLAKDNNLLLSLMY
jgi:hypothetical protein